jgi:predicted transcriptional regulator
MIALPHSTREQARLAYLSGERVTQIAQDLGLQRSTVAQWASRGRWAEDRKAIVMRTTETVGRTAEDVTNRHVLQHQERIHGVVTAQIDSLAKIPLKEAHSILEVARALKTLDDVGRRNLGMDIESDGAVGPRPTFNFHLGSMKLPPRRIISPVEPPAIEVESKVV